MFAGQCFWMGTRPQLMIWCADDPDRAVLIGDHPAYAALTAAALAGERGGGE